jgi:hypothetical protein
MAIRHRRKIRRTQNHLAKAIAETRLEGLHHLVEGAKQTVERRHNSGLVKTKRKMSIASQDGTLQYKGVDLPIQHSHSC